MQCRFCCKGLCCFVSFFLQQKQIFSCKSEIKRRHTHTHTRQQCVQKMKPTHISICAQLKKERQNDCEFSLEQTASAYLVNEFSCSIPWIKWKSEMGQTMQKITCKKKCDNKTEKFTRCSQDETKQMTFLCIFYSVFRNPFACKMPFACNAFKIPFSIATAHTIENKRIREVANSANDLFFAEVYGILSGQVQRVQILKATCNVFFVKLHAFECGCRVTYDASTYESPLEWLGSLKTKR